MIVDAHAILYLALFFSALWLRCSHFFISTGNPVSKGSRPHMFYDVPVQRCNMPTRGSHVLGLPFNPFGRSDSSRPSLPPELPATDYDELPFLLLNVLAGDRVFFTHNRRYSNVLQGGMCAAPSFPKICVDRILTIYPWLKHVISIALLMLLGKKLFRVTMLQYASSSRNLLIEDTRTNVFPFGCPNIPFLVLFCSNFMTTTDLLLTRFVRWLNLKFSYTKPRRLRNVSCQGKHLTA